MVRKLRVQTIRRKGFVKDVQPGVGVKLKRIAPTTVRAHNIPDRGRPGRGPKLFKVEKGELTRFGYKMRNSPEMRHSSLKRAVASQGYATTVRQLNAIAIFNKRDDPDLTRIARSDMAFLKAVYRPNKRR